MRRISAIAVVTAMMVGLSPLSASAGTGTSSDGRLKVGIVDGLAGPTCRHYPLTYSVATAGMWLLGATGSTGAAGDSTSGTGDATGRMQMFVCRPGTYYVDAKLQDFTDDTESSTSTSFVVAETRSAATLNATPTRVRTGAVVTYAGRASYAHDTTSWRTHSYIDMMLQYRLRGTTTWRNYRAFTTDGSGRFSQRIAYRLASPAADIRVRVDATEWSNAAFSPSRRVMRTS